MAGLVTLISVYLLKEQVYRGSSTECITMNPVSKQVNVDQVLVGAIDEALMVIGEPAKKILYFHIENKYLLKPEDIPKKPELFNLALKSLLGAGGVYVEALILKKVCKEFGVEYDTLKDAQFEEAIRAIRQTALA